jgi:hypothetical protein
MKRRTFMSGALAVLAGLGLTACNHTKDAKSKEDGKKNPAPDTDRIRPSGGRQDY